MKINTKIMELDSQLKMKKEDDCVEDNNDNYLRNSFDINVKVEETEVDEDWCIENLISRNVTESVNYFDIKQECLQTCVVCLKFFTDSYCLYKHNLAHLIVPLIRRKIFICNNCPTYCTRKKALIKHITLSHSRNTKESTEKVYKCDICLKTYNYKSFCRHKKEVHADTKLYCNICNNIFKSKHSLKRHIMYVHNGLKPPWRFHKVATETVECLECCKMFMNRYSLTTHMRNCHDKGVHKCEICNSVLKSRSYLLAHMKRVHYDDGKLHTCDVCGKKFKSPRYLKVHITNTHS